VSKGKVHFNWGHGELDKAVLEHPHHLGDSRAAVRGVTHKLRRTLDVIGHSLGRCVKGKFISIGARLA
jgi:hypothetical protein